jgi:hypothetical protein
LRRLPLVAAIALVSSAHVGSPDAWFAGTAGPYQVTVHIEAPPVVPGIAIVNVRVAEPNVERITAFVNTYDAEGGTPPPDELLPAADRPGWRRAQLWVMNSGSNRVTVEVHGSLGPGSVVVPLVAVAQRRLAASATFTVLMIGMGGVLITGMLTLVGAAVREGVLEPGQLADEPRRKRARRAMARAGLVIVLVLTGTAAWWRVEDRAFRNRMFRPLSISTRIEPSAEAARLVLSIDDSSWLIRDDVALLRARGEAPISGLIADHDKLMHLFMVSVDRRVMAHLHPQTLDTITFRSRLPSLPAGTYHVFADVVHQTGFTQTLTSSVVLPDERSAAAPPGDVDDSWVTDVASDPAQFRLHDGTTLTWLRDAAVPLRAREEAGLRFLIEPAAGDSARVEPYLGMSGHAAVVRDDGQVFIHLHPMGTISPAAQQRLSGQPSHPADHLTNTGVMASDTLYFPYAFPERGRYTVWVQLKRNGRILTGAFVATVD